MMFFEVFEYIDEIFKYLHICILNTKFDSNIICNLFVSFKTWMINIKIVKYIFITGSESENVYLRSTTNI